jgi:indolepyruvate decarboxylase
MRLPIDRLILTAWREKLPVYMELPSDVAYLDTEVPAAPLTLAEPPSDEERLHSCIAAIAGRLSAAKSPAILVDADARPIRRRTRAHGAGREGAGRRGRDQRSQTVIDETFPHSPLRESNLHAET